MGQDYGDCNNKVRACSAGTAFAVVLIMQDCQIVELGGALRRTQEDQDGDLGARFIPLLLG